MGNVMPYKSTVTKLHMQRHTYMIWATCHKRQVASPQKSTHLCSYLVAGGTQTLTTPLTCLHHWDFSLAWGHATGQRPTHPLSLKWVNMITGTRSVLASTCPCMMQLNSLSAILALHFTQQAISNEACDFSWKIEFTKAGMPEPPNMMDAFGSRTAGQRSWFRVGCHVFVFRLCLVVTEWQRDVQTWVLSGNPYSCCRLSWWNNKLGSCGNCCF